MGNETLSVAARLWPAMADDPETKERRWKWREASFAGMFIGLVFMALMIAAVLGMFLLAPSIQMTVPKPGPGQETPQALE